ncbi:DUF1707 SHOCT-like domain-containing protein [Corynebacterium pacaense]|uniref:DUF1707 SHOCT-like domain-containing protein n=1 Tax=Corynebacterium pacaense TaxID=1816684 RepID=UPI0009BA2674|nr:DUF1707 domain-containing protein [Corynebacterium pacaense]
MDENSNLRIGDPERHSALDRLGSYFADGYIDINEFDERSGKAAVAQTRGELAHLFDDLPALRAAEAESGLVRETKTQQELDDVVKRNRRVQAIDGVIWSVAMITFFLGLFVFDWDYFWVVFPVAGVASWGVRAAFRLDSEDEEVAEQLERDEKKARAERLRHAANKRRELGS